MPANLTGEFDVVAEFAVPAVDRLLAAMHRCERFPHSMSLRVDDKPAPGLHPAMIESVDAFGDTVVDHARVGRPKAFPAALATTSAVHAGLDMLVNSGALLNDIEVVPSNLAGVAQVQVGPPTVEVPDASGTKLTAKLPLRARYKPDANTARAAEFVHGEVRLTAALNQVVSQTGVSVVEIDIKANDVQIGLAPTWTSTPLSGSDLAGIQLMLRNALRTSFLPSNARLPDRVKHLQVKTLHGGGGAVAVMLNMGPTRGAPSSLSNVFLHAGDDFALGVGRSFVLAAFDPVIQELLTRPVEPVTVSNIFDSATYTITLNEASADLLAGKIVMTVKGRATGSDWWTPNFGFTTKLSFTFAANGDTVDLVPGDISIDTTSTLVQTFAKGAIERGIRKSRDAALLRKGANGKHTYATVNELLSAEKNLGQFLKSLMNPARDRPGLPPLENVFVLLWYTAVDLQPSGLALHGALAVGAWPPAHVEYAPVTPTPGPGPAGQVPQGRDYSALKAWIPGGVIERFEWRALGQTQAFVDEHRFVLLHPEPGLEAASAGVALRALADAAPAAGPLHAYTPLCLTVRGSRLSASGPVVRQAVSGSVCGYGTFPVLDSVSATRGAGAMVALTQPGADGAVHVVGHMPAQASPSDAAIPNRLVHFADDQSAPRLDVLSQAVRESGRADAATAVIAVLTSKQLAGVRHAPDVVYADGDGDAWEHAFGLRGARRPTTLLVSPRGEIVWQQEAPGPLDAAALAAVLRKSLVAGRRVPRTLQTLNLRLGRQVPNFLFELTPGHALTLRKLAGRPAAIVFWRSTSKASIEAVREHQASAKGNGGLVVLAINDGEPAELARRAAAEHGLSATLVTDPQRSIATAFGVSLWPTTVLLDASGAATSIAYGRGGREHEPAPPRDHRSPTEQAS